MGTDLDRNEGTNAGSRVVAEVDRRYERDGIRTAVRRSSREMRSLRRNARALRALWRGQGRERRLEVFRALSPYAKLAYFASGPRATRDLLRKRDWKSYLFRVSRRAARTRPGAVIASHLLFIAESLGGFEHVERPDQILAHDARDAALVLELAMAYAECPIEAFVQAAAVYQRLGDWERALAVGLEAERRMAAGGKSARIGVDGFDVSSAVRASVLLAAKKLGRDEVLLRFAPSVARTPEPAAVLDELYAMITAERYDDALALGRTRRAAGQPLGPEVLANLVAINSFRGDATNDLEFFELALEKLAGNAPDEDFLAQPDLVGNVCWVLNEQQRCDEALALLAAHQAIADALPPVLWDRRMYAARYAGDRREALRRADELLAKHRSEPEFLREQPWALYNAAAALAAAGRREAALAALDVAKQLGCDVSRGSVDDFGPLAGDPELRGVLGVGLVV